MAEIEAWPVAICDAGPLIHLAEIGCLDLLRDFQAVLIPEQVREEVARHRPDALAASVALRRRHIADGNEGLVIEVQTRDSIP